MLSMLCGISFFSFTMKQRLKKRSIYQAAVKKYKDNQLLQFSKSHNVKKIKECIEQGLDIEAKDQYGCTPVIWAAYHNDLELMKYLVGSGAKANVANKKGEPFVGYALLHYAVQNYSLLSDYNNIDMLKYLLTKCSDIEINAKDGKGRTTLLLACERNYGVPAFFLVEKGADVNTAGNNGLTPLLWACYHGNTLLAKELIDKGASVNCANEQRAPFLLFQPIHYAVYCGNPYLVDFLIEEAKVDINVAAGCSNENHFNITCCPFEQSWSRKDESGDFLRGKNYNLQDPYRIHDPAITPLYLALIHGYDLVAESLVEHGALISNHCDNDEPYIFFLACELGNFDFAEYLLEKGVDINARSTDAYDNGLGFTALHWACEKGNVALVSFLIAHGADVTLRTLHGYTPLQIACIQNNYDIAKSLLFAGADVNAEYKRKKPLDYALLHVSSKELVSLLVTHGADVKACVGHNQDLTKQYLQGIRDKHCFISKKIDDLLIEPSRLKVEELFNEIYRMMVYDKTFSPYTKQLVLERLVKLSRYYPRMLKKAILRDFCDIILVNFSFLRNKKCKHAVDFIIKNDIKVPFHGNAKLFEKLANSMGNKEVAHWIKGSREYFDKETTRGKKGQEERRKLYKELERQQDHVYKKGDNAYAKAFESAKIKSKNPLIRSKELLRVSGKKRKRKDWEGRPKHKKVKPKKKKRKLKI